MTSPATVPIELNWTIPPSEGPQTQPEPEITVSRVNKLLGRYKIDDLPSELNPYLAAAAAELALDANLPWRLRPDDEVVVLLRLIARVALDNPQATGVQLRALYQRLTS